MLVSYVEFGPDLSHTPATQKTKANQPKFKKLKSKSWDLLIGI